MNEHISRLVVRGGEVRPKDRYGRLRVLGQPFRVQYDQRWKELAAVCECSCQAVCVVDCRDLLRGKIRSCGCMNACLAR